jgi:hypothetical protein
MIGYAILRQLRMKNGIVKIKGVLFFKIIKINFKSRARLVNYLVKKLIIVQRTTTYLQKTRVIILIIGKLIIRVISQ